MFVDVPGNLAHVCFAIQNACIKLRVPREKDLYDLLL